MSTSGDPDWAGEFSNEHRQLQSPPEPDAGNSSLGERLLAGVIDDYAGPLMSTGDDYDGAGENSSQAMAQAHVYRKITDRSYHDLERHLRRCPKICDVLGIDIVVHHTTFSASWREQFGHRQAYLEEYCEWVRDELREMALTEFDPYLPVVEQQQPSSSRESITDGQKRRCVSNVWGLIEDDLDFDRGPGIEWSVQYLYDLFAEGATRGITPYEVLDKHRKESDDASHKAVSDIRAASRRLVLRIVGVLLALCKVLLEVCKLRLDLALATQPALTGRAALLAGHSDTSAPQV